MCMGSTASEEHSPSQSLPQRTVPRRVKVLSQLLPAFSVSLRLLFRWMEVVRFKFCIIFRRRKMSRSFLSRCWYSPSTDMTAAQLHKRKHPSRVPYKQCHKHSLCLFLSGCGSEFRDKFQRCNGKRASCVLLHSRNGEYCRRHAFFRLSDAN